MGALTEGEIGSGHSGLCFRQFAFSNDARIRFFQILDAIFELALVLWEPLSHLVGSAWHIPTDCGLESHNGANLEFCVRAWGRPGFLHAPFRRAVEGQDRTPAGYAVTSPHPDQGLDHRPTKRRSLRWSRTVVLRFRTVVAGAGPKQPKATLTGSIPPALNRAKLSQRSPVLGRRHARGPPKCAGEARLRGKPAIKSNLGERRASRRDHCLGALQPPPADVAMRRHAWWRQMRG